MTIAIHLSPEQQRKLALRAASRGQDVADYVVRLIERDILDANATSTSVDEALAPFRRQVQESGITDEELIDLVEEIREDIWREKHGRPSKVS